MDGKMYALTSLPFKLGLMNIVVWLMVICELCHCGEGFQLVITHTNDVHARIEEADKYGGNCDDKERAQNKCFGGVARRETKLKELRAQYPDNFLLLDAGDQFQGTLWFYVYSGKAAAHFMNLLKYDAMAIGNHEFDMGVAELTDFLDNVTFPVLACNIDASNQDNIVGKFAKSHTFTMNGEKIGVIGYSTVETPVLSETENLVFLPEVDEIQAEVIRLEGLGVNKIIALGHSGIKTDKVIAKQVQGVDIVIGGHSNTFLYSGDKPSSEDVEGEYPTVIDQEGGNKALVITDYAFGKYLGFLKVNFDNDGKVTTWEGNPTLLDSSVVQDEAMMAEIVQWRELIENQAKELIGKTNVFLDGRTKSCRLKECNLGNLIADAMVVQNLRHADETQWTNVSVAIMNGGGIRTPIDQGPINAQSVLAVLPFRNTIDIIEIRGEHLVGTFERSVSKYDTEQLDGAFLQVSGVKVTYDLSKPSGSRVANLQVRCSDCLVPEYFLIDKNKVYQVLVPSYIVKGGDGYDVVKNNVIKHHILGDVDADVLLEYITRYTPITHGVEGRVIFGGEKGVCTTTSSTTTRTTDHLSSLLATVLIAVNKVVTAH